MILMDSIYISYWLSWIFYTWTTEPMISCLGKYLLGKRGFHLQATSQSTHWRCSFRNYPLVDKRRNYDQLWPTIVFHELLSTMVNGKFMVNLVTLWLCQNSYWKFWFIVTCPMKHGDFPSFFANVYQKLHGIVWYFMVFNPTMRIVAMLRKSMDAGAKRIFWYDLLSNGKGSPKHQGKHTLFCNTV